MDLMQGLKTFLVAAVAMGASYLNGQFGWIDISAEGQAYIVGALMVGMRIITDSPPLASLRKRLG